MNLQIYNLNNLYNLPQEHTPYTNYRCSFWVSGLWLPVQEWGEYCRILNFQVTYDSKLEAKNYVEIDFPSYLC